ncbi:MAG TPA: glycosyltransferase [Gemmatimonadota bacterium]|nr:glycosyltransferase [Gemmatimonadota bacterium]
MPLISVIVPAFNAESSILETVASVRRQTCRDFEILVIDDGSTDGTLAALAGVRDDRLRLLSFENGGLSAARNRGIEHSRGEFLAFIDADDLWAPEKLESQLDALRRRPDAGIAYSWTAFVDDGGRFLFAKEPQHFEGDVYADLLRECFIASGSNVMIRRRCVDSVGPFDVSLRSAEDWEYWLRVAARWPFVVVPRYQVLYRLSTRSMSSEVGTIEAASVAVLERGIAAAPPGVECRREECLANLKQYVAFLCLTRAAGPDVVAQAGRRLWEAIRLYPRTLLRSKTRRLIGAWLILRLVPRRAAPRVVRGLLRLHGRWMALRTPQIRRSASTMSC